MGVLIFNVSTDRIEVTPEDLLEDTLEDVHVGEFFDTVDRDYLGQSESGLAISTENSDSELLPSIVLPTESSLDDSISLSFPSLPFVTSTPTRPAGDLFVFASPSVSPISNETDQSDLDSRSSSDFEYLARVRGLPRRVRYSSEDTDILGPDLPVRWQSRPLKCLKCVDDCVSVEKVFFKDALRVNANGVQTALAKATKTQDHFRTIEFNAVKLGMEINNSKTRMLCVTTARSYIPASYLYSSDETRI